MAEERQPLRPVFDPPASEERADARALVAALQLRAHPEGGYYAETYASALTIPSPYPAAPACSGGGPAAEQRAGFDVALRRAATAIFYYLTPARPTGVFHRNRSPIVHALHKGRARYVVIHPGPQPGTGTVDSFVVGQDVARGEKLQWVVPGGAYKATILQPDPGCPAAAPASGGMLITEVTAPGFEVYDHDFLLPEALVHLVGEERAAELQWLVRGS